ncbi:Zn-dependent exopeptidase [Phellopilus nigrolimitatus]|nr:Zn-dependent exopeptidase [Phellopilus nigrolimitatus]
MDCQSTQATSNQVFPSPPDRTHPSLSRDIPQEASSPTLMHTLHTETSSVLSVTADEKHIYSGSQGYDIFVWDRFSFAVKTTLRGHTGSVLALEVAKEKGWLFSSSGDSTVRVWCTSNLSPIYIITPYLESDSGDLFCLSYSPTLDTVYFGCQNTSLQWFDFTDLPSSEKSVCPYINGFNSSSPDPFTIRESDVRPGSKRNKFFGDGYASGQATPTPLCKEDAPKPLRVLQVMSTNVIDSAHYGYVYSMALLPSSLESNVGREDKDMVYVLLVTGSGDETVKLWKCTPSGPVLVHTFDASAGAVLSLVVRHESVYAGCQDGHVKVFDLETKTLVRTIIAQEGVDILSLSMIDTDLYTCFANGEIRRWSASFDCTASWQAHDGIVLSSFITRCEKSGSWRLVTGANDNCIKLWHIDRPKSRRGSLSMKGRDGSESPADNRSMHDTMLHALSKFISIPSISSEDKHREDCRQAAIWLKKCFTQLGAEAVLLPTAEGRNPLVLGTFTGSQSKQNRPRVLFYGHYDVMAAPPKGWNSDPFTLTARDGYLYGRGATDDKGPILAVACAASELLVRRELECDLVFLIEGEEETGSFGFSEAVRQNKKLIGDVDAILVSNSTWIDEDRPCVTYGMRGVVHCCVEISSDRDDRHSGVDGGAVPQPMFDMVKLLASLSEGQQVLIPCFYDAVRPQTKKESELYELLSTVTGKSASSFSSKWREPSLTIHNVMVSGPGNATVIPATVKAKVSLRIVPDQDLDTIIHSLREHLLTSFDAIKSPNSIDVQMYNVTDWWLGDIEGRWFKALEGAIKDEWGVEPLRIREGGSIPSVPYLEKEFKCPALHLPLGQSSVCFRVLILVFVRDTFD